MPLLEKQMGNAIRTHQSPAGFMYEANGPDFAYSFSDGSVPSSALPMQPGGNGCADPKIGSRYGVPRTGIRALTGHPLLAMSSRRWRVNPSTSAAFVPANGPN